MTSRFFHGISLGSWKESCSSTCSLNFSPNILVDASEKKSICVSILHLFARYQEMRPFFLAAAQPVKVEWKLSPYLGVLPLVFRALSRVFPGPRICTMDAGYLLGQVGEAASMHSTPLLTRDAWLGLVRTGCVEIIEKKKSVGWYIISILFYLTCNSTQCCTDLINICFSLRYLLLLIIVFQSHPKQ